MGYNDALVVIQWNITDQHFMDYNVIYWGSDGDLKSEENIMGISCEYRFNGDCL